MRGRRVRDSGGVFISQSYETERHQGRLRRLWLFLLLGAVAGSFLAWRAHYEWEKVEHAPMGEFSAPATLVSDPTPFGSGSSVRAIFRVQGWRYEASFFGGDARKVARHLAGESVWLSGTRVEVPEQYRKRSYTRHVVGRITNVTLSSQWRDGSSFTRATNRLRRLLTKGASHLPAHEASLLLGLVIGDDRAQPREMISSFRDSGLSHLTAVSGQNIAFVIAAASPLLTRLRPRARLAASLVVLAWFTVITRAEPSVLRAAAMASVAVVSFTFGWAVRAPLVLAVSAYGLALIDPMLLWSVGFWLSVGATAGLVFIMAPLSRLLLRWKCPQILISPLSSTLAAQAGTLLPMFLTFGRIAPIGIITNLLAVPVAGMVMLVGLPVCLLAGLTGAVGSIVTIPLAFGVRWVWWVAVIGQRVAG
jgi:competence protein ComEC